MTTPTPARKKVAREKPSKPHPDYPLFAHASGQWAKKVNQKMYYFGPWADSQAALERWLDEKDDLLAGRTPSKGTLTVITLVNAFLTSKKRKVQSGELKERTLESYDRRMPTVLAVFGKGRHVDTIRPTDFEKLRAKFAEKHGPSTLAGDVAIVRMLFEYAYKADLIDRPVKFGPEFNPPSRATMRRHRQQRGKRMFTAHQIRRLAKASGLQLRAMVYLGINCGFGNHDCALLPLPALDLRNGWINFPRPKTGIERRCPLWPKTVDALRAVLDKRRDHESDRVFITKYGNTWEPKSMTDNPISKETVKVLQQLGYHRRGLAFYGLRHTFQTIGEKSRDKDAVRAIMGHVEAANDMSAVYNEEPVEDSRLQTVTDYIYRWLATDRTR